MERPDERKTMVFITHSIDEAIVLGDRVAVMSARPGRIKEVLDLPFGWPRDADAVRTDPRFAELRLHIWRQLHTARPRSLRRRRRAEGGRVSTLEHAGESRRRRAARREGAAEQVAAAPARRQWQIIGIRLASLAIVLSIWQVFGANIDPVLFTTPSKIFLRRRHHDRQRRAVDHLWPSLVVLGIGMAFAVVFGIAIGLLLARFWFLDVALGVYITFLYSIPSVALVPLIVLWAGFEMTAKVIVLFLFAFFPMVINTYQGVKTVDPKLLEVGRAFRCSERQLWANIVLPAALPFIVTGLRLAVGRGLIGMVLADLYTAISGIGYLIVRTASTYQVDKMFVPIVTLGLLGVTLTALLRLVETYVAPWTVAARATSPGLARPRNDPRAEAPEQARPTPLPR